MTASRSPFFTFWPSLKATLTSCPSRRLLITTVLNAPTDPNPVRYTGRSRVSALATATEITCAPAPWRPPLPRPPFPCCCGCDCCCCCAGLLQLNSRTSTIDTAMRRIDGLISKCFSIHFLSGDRSLNLPDNSAFGWLPASAKQRCPGLNQY